MPPFDARPSFRSSALSREPETPELRREDAFTLIELLVVMAIIGILAAIAIPTLLDQQKKGMDTAAKSDVRDLAGMVEECQLESNAKKCNSAAELNGAPGLTWSTGGEPGTVQVTKATGERFRAVAVSKATTNGQYHTFTWVGRDDNSDRRLCTAGGGGDSAGGCVNGSW
jgi:type IV pilus assembly protein PilA